MFSLIQLLVYILDEVLHHVFKIIFCFVSFVAVHVKHFCSKLTFLILYNTE